MQKIVKIYIILDVYWYVVFFSENIPKEKYEYRSPLGKPVYIYIYIYTIFSTREAHSNIYTGIMAGEPRPLHVIAACWNARHFCHKSYIFIRDSEEKVIFSLFADNKVILRWLFLSSGLTSERASCRWLSSSHNI